MSKTRGFIMISGTKMGLIIVMALAASSINAQYIMSPNNSKYKAKLSSKSGAGGQSNAITTNMHAQTGVGADESANSDPITPGTHSATTPATTSATNLCSIVQGVQYIKSELHNQCFPPSIARPTISQGCSSSQISYYLPGAVQATACMFMSPIGFNTPSTFATTLFQCAKGEEFLGIDEGLPICKRVPEFFHVAFCSNCPFGSYSVDKVGDREVKACVQYNFKGERVSLYKPVWNADIIDTESDGDTWAARPHLTFSGSVTYPICTDGGGPDFYRTPADRSDQIVYKWRMSPIKVFSSYHPQLE